FRPPSARHRCNGRSSRSRSGDQLISRTSSGQEAGAVLQTIVNGLLYGGTLAVAAVGFSLIFGVMNIINLAHGVFVIGGAYAALVAWAQFGIDPFLMLAPPLVLGFGLGWLVERLIIGPSVRKSGPVMALLVTFGVSLIVANLLTVMFSSSVR